jgi:ubiquinone/menaquinone biosynthesis C-methylase UbiE
MSSSAEAEQDQWSRWVLRNSRECDAETAKAVQDMVLRKILQHAAITAGETVLDVGAGNGLIGFGAMPLVSERGKVIFSDISMELLDHCRAVAEEMGVLERCEFVHAAAEDLSALPDGSVDVVALKAVLIYVKEKQQAFREFRRVLRPGGRLYVEEPINRFGSPEPETLFWGYDVTPVQDLAARIRAVYERIQPAESDPMLDFDERDLTAFAEEAGFGTIEMELRATVDRRNLACTQIGWEGFWRNAGNPRIPTLEQALAEALTPEEAHRFVAYLRPKVERESRQVRSARTYLWAVR